MKRILYSWLAASLLFASSAWGQQRAIVRVLGGQTVLAATCGQIGCNIIRDLEDPLGQLFLVGIADTADLTSLLRWLSTAPGILNAEADRRIHVLQNRPPIPATIYDETTTTYFGAPVRSGYISQPAVGIVRLKETQNAFGVTGNATVAVIDTGVDPDHPVLKPVLAEGYDFTRNRPNGSETGDVTQSTVAVVDGVPPTFVNDNAAGVVDQSTASAMNNPAHHGFGHGTMVAGIIHLVAPTATILPLKAFGPDGSGHVSDILRAVYTAVRMRARVINMSFGISQPSRELERSIDHASRSGVVCVASAGNNGAAATVYPAAHRDVIGVASTNNDDVRSTFSNFGTPTVWVAAPGEGVVTTYPYGTYAAAWGTSFSTPFVAGAAALLLQANASLSPGQVAAAIAHAKPLTSDLGYGRLDILSALQSR